MIINIRGTSGSGKSTIVKTVIDELVKLGYTEEQVFRPGRKRPLLTRYQVGGDRSSTRLSVIGHYEIACGGCDTIQSQDDIYALVLAEALQHRHVIYEGLLVGAETRRPIELFALGVSMLVIGLTTPLEECLASVNARRRAKRGEDAPGVNPKNTESKYKGVASSMRKLEGAGVPTVHLSREEALQRVRRELGI